MALDMMAKSIGKKIQLERGGHDKVVGELVSIRSDHIVLRTEKHEILYCSTSHIKSITEPIVLAIQAPQPVNGQADQQSTMQAPVPQVPIEEAANTQELLNKMVHTLIAVNHGGHNAIKGVLIDVGSDYITLIHDMKDYVHYPTYHIRSLSRIYNIENNNAQEQSGNEKEQKGHSGDGKDQKKQG